MEGDKKSRTQPWTLDPALVELCRSMTPAERLAAAVRLTETTLEFHRAGVEFRRAAAGRSAPGRKR